MTTTAQLLTLSINTMRLACAREAITALALLKPDAEDIIYHLLDDHFHMVQHPRAICTAYRKDGEQLAVDEKRTLGIRANSFLSRRAFHEITDRGLRSPLDAHETTLLRASFSLNRFKGVLNDRKLPAPAFQDEFEYDVQRRDCAVCWALDGTIVEGSHVHLFAPPGCTCDTANFILKPHVDWVRGIT